MAELDDDERFYRDTEAIAFPKINDGQLTLLESLGQRRILHRGELLYKAGQRELGLFVVLRGAAEVFEKRDDVEQILGTHGPRSFIGDVTMLQGTATLANARIASDEAEVLEVPAQELRRALADLPGVGETIVSAFIMRRQRLMRDREFAGLRIISDRESHDGRQMHDFLTKNHIPHRFVVTESEAGKRLADHFHLANRDLPALITPAGTPLRRPSLREVAQVAGLLRPLARNGESEILTDLAIIGAGPAGLAAAVYAASEGLQTVVIEGYAPGGQAGSSSLIENFFGFPTGISGGDLTYRAQLQAYRFGARFSTPAQALELEICEHPIHPMSLQIEGCPIPLRAKCLLLATGAEYRRLNATGREDFEGCGCYYAATALEAQLCRGSTVVVVGAGNSAGQAAMFLSEAADRVLLVVRGQSLGSSMSDYLSRRVEHCDKIEILYQTEVTAMSGDKMLRKVELVHRESRSRRVVDTPAVFSMIGADPCTRWLPAAIERDEKGFIKTGAAVADAPRWKNSSLLPTPLETSVPGIFAAGDVRSGSVKRCAAAVGEGGMAIAGVQEAIARSTRPVAQ